VPQKLAGRWANDVKGVLKGFWAVTVRANWRIIFRFANSKASDVDFVDYH
jgi:proteic killer suppression protein